VTPRAVLVGLPGAGKSSTGRRLAKVLAVPFADSDLLVEAREGRSVAELFASHGEPAYRRIEAEVIAAALREFAGVLSLGGGALTHDATRAALTEGAIPLVYLRATVDTLLARIGDGESRPLLAGDPPGRLAVLAAGRVPVYESIATFAVDTDGKTPGQVAATIAARLHQLEVARRG
jgi:shikimate kinase